MIELEISHNFGDARRLRNLSDFWLDGNKENLDPKLLYKTRRTHKTLSKTHKTRHPRLDYGHPLEIKQLWVLATEQTAAHTTTSSTAVGAPTAPKKRRRALGDLTRVHEENEARHSKRKSLSALAKSEIDELIKETSSDSKKELPAKIHRPKKRIRTDVNDRGAPTKKLKTNHAHHKSKIKSKTACSKADYAFAARKVRLMR
eukprot:240479_1